MYTVICKGCLQWTVCVTKLEPFYFRITDSWHSQGLAHLELIHLPLQWFG